MGRPETFLDVLRRQNAILYHVLAPTLGEGGVRTRVRGVNFTIYSLHVNLRKFTVKRIGCFTLALPSLHHGSDETETYRTCGRPVEFNDETYGETRGLMVADAETYGADRLWCLLKPIPVELDSDSETSEPPELPTTEDETV